ncbi:hypothetical protein P3342_002422 [Pyrenophora teres f. teres]|nr:hypothetical protein P3342_002422 [Pyrenophora teres f. teres]
MESQTSRKRNRHSKKDKIAAPYDDCSDYDSVPKCNRRSQRSASKPSRAPKKAKKSDRLLAEVADLADYNKPPLERSLG